MVIVDVARYAQRIDEYSAYGTVQPAVTPDT